MHHSSMSWEITLLYLFSWNFISFLQKEHIKVQNFRLSTALGWNFTKNHKNLVSFDPSTQKSQKFPLSLVPFVQVYNVCPKKVQRGYLSWHWRATQNLKKNWLLLWKMTWGIWQIFIRTLESVKIGTFMASFCPK